MDRVAEAPGGARLAQSQLRRIRRIVDAAVALAEEGGFDGVRLRDVAESSDVALGTLYKYFRSKEDILLYALGEETERLEAVMAERPPRGGTPVDRVTDLFGRATRGLVRRPQLARAALRSLASGDHATSVQAAGFHLRSQRMIVAARRGERPDFERPLAEAYGSDRERRIAVLLSHVWFASLVGWSGGLHGQQAVIDQMRAATEMLLRGAS
jgi:AcrR family transcriptional regulator